MLVMVGAVLVVVAVLLRDRQTFASTLAVVGLGAIVVAILRPRLRSFSVGPKGVDAQLDRIEQKVDEIIRSAEIRKALAELVAEGDQVANTLMVTRDMAIEDLRQNREPTYDERTWNAVGEWLGRVRDFLHATPEIGEAEVILFDTHGELPPYELKVPDRFDAELGLVRERQGRLRALIERLRT